MRLEYAHLIEAELRRITYEHMASDRRLEILALIHGDAPGADKLADDIGRRLGYLVLAYPAEWEKFGNRAGPIRNQKMLTTGPGHALFFHDDPTLGKGTRDMFMRCCQAGIDTKIVLYGGGDGSK